MSIRVPGGQLPNIPGAKALSRIMWVRVRPNLGLGADVTITANGAPTATSPFAVAGGFSRVFTDQRFAYQFAPTLAAGALLTFKGFNATEQPALGFRQNWDGDTALGSIEAAVIDGLPLASVVQAYLRKLNNVNITSARQRFGFSYSNLSGLGSSAIKPTVGLFGDGVAGFRCGSVHCPDGAAAGQSAFGAADAGAVSPPILANPGLSWWHCKVKMIPPTLASPAAVGVYVDGRLVFQSQLLANFPRGSLATNRGYQQVEAEVFTDFDAVTQLNGFLVADFEAWYDTDLTL
jgi:hypothetical protein